MIDAARSVNPDALEDPAHRATAGPGLDRNRADPPACRYRALSKVIKGEKNWPEVPFAKLQWSLLAQTLAELAVDLLGPAGLLARGGPDAVDRGKWTRLYSFQRYTHHRRRLDRGAEEHHRRPGHQAARPGPPLLTVGRSIRDGRRPASSASAATPGAEEWADGAPEPLAMWEEVARLAAADAGGPGTWPSSTDRRRLLPGLAVRRPCGRLAERLGAGPRSPPTPDRGHRPPDRSSPRRPRPWPAANSTWPWSSGERPWPPRRRLPKDGPGPVVAPFPKRPALPPRRLHPDEARHSIFQACSPSPFSRTPDACHLGALPGDHRDRSGD